MSSQITTLSQQKSFAQTFIKRVQCNAPGNLGGVISASKSEISNNIPGAFWSNISSTRAASGGTRYHCFYFYNSHDSIYAQNPIVYISQTTSSPSDEVSIALGAAGINGTEQSVLDEFTAPSSPVLNFVQGTTRTSGLNVNSPIPPLGWFGVWVADIIKVNADSYAFNNYKIRIEIQDPAITYIPTTTNQDIAIPISSAAGNSGNNTDFDTVLSKIKKRKTGSCLTLGNNSYETTGTTWLQKLESQLTKQTAKQIVHMCFGNEDWSPTVANRPNDQSTQLINQYKNYFGYQQPFNAFTVENVRVITLHCNTAGGVDVLKGSDQYTFAQNQLAAAHGDSRIDWIIVAMPWPLFFPKTDTGVIPKTAFATDYHPLFEQYQVHVYLFAHVSLYCRFGVLQFNSTTPTAPTELLSGQQPNYSFTGQGFNNGCLHIGAGTAGAVTHGDSDHIISTVTYQHADIENLPGYLYLETLNNGKKLHGIWYDINDVLRDEWSITKT